MTILVLCGAMFRFHHQMDIRVIAIKLVTGTKDLVIDMTPERVEWGKRIDFGLFV